MTILQIIAIEYDKSIITLFSLFWQDLPSPDANQIAINLYNLGQIYNKEDLATDSLANFDINISSKVNKET